VYSKNNKLSELKFPSPNEDADVKFKLVCREYAFDNVDDDAKYDFILVDNLNEGHDYYEIDYSLVNQHRAIIVNGSESPFRSDLKSATIGLESWDLDAHITMSKLPGVWSEINSNFDNNFLYDFLILVGQQHNHRMLFLNEFNKMGLLEKSLYKPSDLRPYEVYFNLAGVDKFESYKKFSMLGIDWLDLAHLPHKNMFASCAINIILETTALSNTNYPFLTEKTYKCLLQQRPFTLLGDVGSLAKLKRDGFKTFSDVIDESYDYEQNMMVRIKKVANASKELREKLDTNFDQIKEICIHNQRHFLDIKRIRQRYETFGETLTSLLKRCDDFD
jgi:hypothetical protein